MGTHNAEHGMIHVPYLSSVEPRLRAGRPTYQHLLFLGLTLATVLKQNVHTTHYTCRVNSDIIAISCLSHRQWLMKFIKIIYIIYN